ncbi:PaaX family transcriptional regulator [Streptomyces tauricus]
MKPRDLVFELFGDYLRYRGGAVRLRSLTALMDCFAIPAGTVRVVVARMRKEGWLTSRKEGRETHYALTAKGWHVLDERRARIFEWRDAEWDGQWHMIMYSVPETERSSREELRQLLVWHGFGAASPSVWVSPTDRTGAVVKAAHEDSAAVRLDVFHARSSGPDADTDLAQRAWDLVNLRSDYEDFIDRWEPVADQFRQDRPEPTEALVRRVEMIHAFRPLAFRDPDLPTRLLPEGWRGQQARNIFFSLLEALKEPSRAAADALVSATAGSRSMRTG